MLCRSGRRVGPWCRCGSATARRPGRRWIGSGGVSGRPSAPGFETFVFHSLNRAPYQTCKKVPFRGFSRGACARTRANIEKIINEECPKLHRKKAKTQMFSDSKQHKKAREEGKNAGKCQKNGKHNKALDAS